MTDVTANIQGMSATAQLGKVTVATESYVSLQVQIITPEKTFFSGAAAMVVAPGVEGEFGALPGHAPFISALKPGIVTVEELDGKKRYIAVMGGFAEVNPEHCIVLAETALDCSTLTSEDVQARIAEARAALQEVTPDEQARSDAEKKLAFAEAIEFLMGETLLN